MSFKSINRIKIICTPRQIYLLLSYSNLTDMLKETRCKQMRTNLFSCVYIDGVLAWWESGRAYINYSLSIFHKLYRVPNGVITSNVQCDN